jgi:hypothetical protein
MPHLPGLPSPHEEAKALLQTYRQDLPAILAVLERQLNTIHLRAQVIIGFAAIAVTTTGFSGRLIAATNSAAQFCIILGLSVILLGCFWIFVRVMGVKWVITGYLAPEPEATIARIVRYRNHKTFAYRLGGYVIFSGLLIYAVSIAIMLLNPEPIQVPIR